MLNLSLFKEFWEFAREHKRYWLLPILFSMALLGALVIFGKTSAIAPFIYYYSENFSRHAIPKGV